MTIAIFSVVAILLMMLGELWLSRSSAAVMLSAILWRFATISAEAARARPHAHGRAIALDDDRQAIRDDHEAHGNSRAGGRLSARLGASILAFVTAVVRMGKTKAVADLYEILDGAEKGDVRTGRAAQDQGREEHERSLEDEKPARRDANRADEEEKDRQSTDTRAKESRIRSELLQGVGGRLHEQTVNGFGVGPS